MVENSSRYPEITGPIRKPAKKDVAAIMVRLESSTTNLEANKKILGRTEGQKIEGAKLEERIAIYTEVLGLLGQSVDKQ